MSVSARLKCWSAWKLLIALLLPALQVLVSHGAPLVVIPERMGVVDVIPNEMSAEINQDCEPSLAVGVGTRFGKLAAHTFNFVNVGGMALGLATNRYYTSLNGGIHWTNNGTFADYDTTLDWSSSGSAYAAQLQPTPRAANVLASSDPAAGVVFSSLGLGSTYSASGVDQPWLKVQGVNQGLNIVDHIYVGLNDQTIFPGRSAAVHFSTDSGVTWTNVFIENSVLTAVSDSPSVRLAISPDGRTVYALFQRFNTVLGSCLFNPGPDYSGDVVLMRDDNTAGSFAGLTTNGTLVATGITLPGPGSPTCYPGTVLGVQRLGSSCDVAVDPNSPAAVYVAYTEVLNARPVLRVQISGDYGQTFQLAYSITNASLPALAVATDRTVGLLYAAEAFSFNRLSYQALVVADDLQIHFLKAPDANFNAASIIDSTLASFPNNNPARVYNPYLGDYFTLRAVGYDFFGVFCASGAPIPEHFPKGVYYQRNVKVNGVINSNFSLPAAGELVDLAGVHVDPTIDPFFFYDLAPIFPQIPKLRFVPQRYQMGDPFHLTWAALPTDYPQFRLQSASVLGGSWTTVTNANISQTNGVFDAALTVSPQPQLFRLTQDVASGQFGLFASAGKGGSLSPSGVTMKGGTQNQTFTATPSNNYAMANWVVDGVLSQTTNATLTLSNISTEHTVLATFVASNDVAVSVSGDPNPASVSNNLAYVARVANLGLNSATGVVLSNTLPSTVLFASANATQGSVSHAGNLVTANIGTLAPGASAVLTIVGIPVSTGFITNIARVACNQAEPDVSNNVAVDINRAFLPVAVTFQPQSISTNTGATVTLTAGVSGTPPPTIQWFFNGALLPNASSPTLTLTNVTTNNAGVYSLTASQVLGPEDEFEEDTDPATLTVFAAGTALNLDGASGVVQIGATAVPAPWTAEFWVNRQVAFDNSATLLGDSFTALKLEQFQNTRQVGFTRFGVADYLFNYVAPTNVWVHLAFVCDTSTRLYVDGVLQDTNAATIPLPLGQLGADIPGRYSNHVRGTLDEVRVWNVACSPAQIQSNMNHLLAVPQTNLVAYWRFDEGSGTNAFDSSGNAKTGTLQSGAAWVNSGAPISP